MIYLCYNHTVRPLFYFEYRMLIRLVWSMFLNWSKEVSEQLPEENPVSFVHAAFLSPGCTTPLFPTQIVFVCVGCQQRLSVQHL